MMAGLIHLILAAGFLAVSIFGMPGSEHHGVHTRCPAFREGTLDLYQWQLYPDSAVFDFDNCVLYISALFNGSMVKYDPYKNKPLEIISFPGISDVFDEHASGLHLGRKSGVVSLVIDAQPAFLTNGANASGDYWLVKYDTRARRELWRANLTSVTQARWAGFQDVTVDARGNSYVVGTYPRSILRVDKTGRHITPWLPPQQPINTTLHGYTGICSTGDTLLVVDANGVPEELSEGNSQLYRFDMRQPTAGKPVLVPRTPRGVLLPNSDAIHLPERYGGTVMFVAHSYIGITVLRSRNGWRSAEQLGTIPSDFPAFFQRIISSTVQIGSERQFMIGQKFPGSIVPGTKGGNQSDFPFFDITAQVEALLA
ncbi:hypothetical protein B0H63DRAFT_411587 [Podospora didyma]|uniref:TRI14-like protein n=1 Tax=Podospora didyma TaxID=330526 RepID=A0AAE0U0W3_9PEZI|nr:hypothetical protein B0H63DRAFT_411587 [Podospora didyma]